MLFIYYLIISTTNKSKRERATNLIDSELSLLVDLVVRLKKTDTVTAKMKNKAWLELAKTFNSKSLNGYRNEKCLRLKYENLKKIVIIEGLAATTR